MADNFLEYHREEYEKKKAKWLSKQKHKIFRSAMKAISEKQNTNNERTLLLSIDNKTR